MKTKNTVQKKAEGEKVSIFSIPIGGKCKFSDGGAWTIKRHFYRRMPRLGKMLHCEAVNSEGKKQLFITNYLVEQV